MKIVLCDDHRLFLEALAIALAGCGFEVVATVTAPADAVDAVVRHDADLLLTDLTFPVGSGLDAARRVLAERPRTTVVVITGTDALGPLAEALELGVSGYLFKDQPIAAIADALTAAQQGGLVVHRELLRSLRTPGPVPRQRRRVDALTPREQHVLKLLVEGLNTNDIVQRMAVSQSTVRTHVQNILSKLGVHSRLQAVAALAAEDRLVPLETRYAVAD